MINTIKIMRRGGNGETIKEKRKAPTIKSSWSAIGNKDPGGKPNRRLIKESNKSPISAPSESTNPRDASY